MRALRGLYPIVDLGVLDARRIDAVAFASAVLESEPAILQLRAKYADASRTLTLAQTLRALCEAQGTRFILNDHADLALQAGADWVHVGQSDLPAADVRGSFPSLSFGISTHTEEQLRLALAVRPAYVAYGPVFDTQTKEDPDATVGLEGLRTAHGWSTQANIPLVAIGGVTETNLPGVAANAELVAVISGLVPATDFAAPSFFSEVADTAKRYQRIMSESQFVDKVKAS